MSLDTNFQLQQIVQWRETKGGLLIGFTAVFCALGNIGVVLRLLGQWRVSRRFYVDDLMLIFALACADAISGLFLVITDCDWAFHPDETVTSLVEQELQFSRKLLKVFFVTTIFNGPCLLAIRLSLLHLYRRVLILNERWIRILWSLVYGYNVAWGLGTTIYYVFHCRPTDWFWNRIVVKLDAKGNSKGICDPQPATDIPFMFSLPADIGTLSIPIIIVSRMYVKKKKKIGLSLLFSLGLIACFCEIGRVVVEFHEHSSTDALYALTNFAIFTAAEFHLAIFCACLPLCVTLYHAMCKFIRNHGLSIKSSRQENNAIDGESGGYDRGHGVGSFAELSMKIEATGGDVALEPSSKTISAE